jgi:hypothetical protein
VRYVLNFSVTEERGKSAGCSGRYVARTHDGGVLLLETLDVVLQLRHARPLTCQLLLHTFCSDTANTAKETQLVNWFQKQRSGPIHHTRITLTLSVRSALDSLSVTCR